MADPGGLAGTQVALGAGTDLWRLRGRTVGVHASACGIPRLLDSHAEAWTPTAGPFLHPVAL